ncbi:hypothetical protein CRE_17175 [Caenorhabditis remanei]|uniref:Uncharacterized protein n=1 Tax=Caenorhabditis remanei TaxID=31234 RepID=E3M9V0_CAERE|nr:hypothetical protein CRE_17175 [Caenorhabditis remanei]
MCFVTVMLTARSDGVEYPPFPVVENVILPTGNKWDYEEWTTADILDWLQKFYPNPEMANRWIPSLPMLPRPGVKHGLVQGDQDQPWNCHEDPDDLWQSPQHHLRV